MRFATCLLMVLLTLVFVVETQAQCRRGGQGGGARPQRGIGQPLSFAQSGVNPLRLQQVAFQQRALLRQQAALQQQTAAVQQFAMQQQWARMQARQAQLVRRRAGAEARREEELSKREKQRRENRARLEARRTGQAATS